MKKLMAIIAVLAVVVVADYFYSLYHVPPKLDFRALSLTDMNGKPVSIAALKGKKLLINFFQASDDSCNHKISLLEKAQAALDKDNFLFLCISDEPLSRLDSLRKSTGTNLLFLRSTEKLNDLNIMTLPTMYILDPKGEMVYKKTGERNWADTTILQTFRAAE